MCAILHSWETIEPKAALPLLYFAEGITALRTKERGAIRMNVTYAELFQFCIFVVALVGLCYQIFKDKKK